MLYKLIFITDTTFTIRKSEEFLVFRRGVFDDLASLRRRLVVDFSGQLLGPTFKMWNRLAVQKRP